jgi:hypothetical protein
MRVIPANGPLQMRMGASQPALLPINPARSPGVSKPTTSKLELLGSATNTPSMPRKRKIPAEFSPFGCSGGHLEPASKARGPDYRQKEGKQIERAAACSKQDVVSALVSAAVQGRMESIADQLGPADTRFVQAIASCMGDAGGAVVQQMMADLAAASERAEEAERREQLSWRGRSKNSNFRVHNAFAGSYLLLSSRTLVPI